MSNKDPNFKQFLQMAEYPFIRQDMTEEEFEEEYQYFAKHYDDYRNGTYKSLYEQRKIMK